MKCKTFQIFFIIDWRIWEKCEDVKTCKGYVSYSSHITYSYGMEKIVKLLVGYIAVLFFPFFPLFFFIFLQKIWDLNRTLNKTLTSSDTTSLPQKSSTLARGLFNY